MGETYIQSLNIQNFQLGRFEGEGKMDIQIIYPTKAAKVKKCVFAGFGENVDDERKYGCHFFQDDYRFQRVWNSPLRYLCALRKYKTVLAPDFSLFVDYPKALAVYNHYRKHWCARDWQANGIQVSPVINWMYEDSFEWCFDGEPHEAVVAVSSKGVNQSAEMIEMFRKGYEEMERRLNPEKVLWFGNFCLEEKRDNIIMCKTTFEERIKMLRENHNKNKKKQGDA